MKKISMLLAMLLLLGLNAGVFAQDDEDEARDILEVAIHGGLSSPMSGIADWTTEGPGGPIDFGAKSGLGFGVDIGYFATPSIVVGFNLGYSVYSIETDIEEISSGHHRIYSPALYLKYYFFGESDFVPYLRGNVGVDVPKFASLVYDHDIEGYEWRELAYDPAFAFGLGAGMFWYTHDYGGIFVEASYHNGMTDGVGGEYQGLPYDFGQNASLLGVHAGIKVFFGSD